MNSALESSAEPAAAIEPSAGRPLVTKRHGLFTRAWHWTNFVCLIVLLMSGLQIFNAHPALYWGSGSNFSDPLLAIGPMHGPHGHIIGVTRVFGHDFNTTGVLGVSEENGQPTERAFPDWITLPGPQWLALGRAWHFTAAWIFSIALTGYLLYSLISRRRRRLLAPTAGELRGLPATIASHARFRFHHARNYNILQKLTYLLVIFGLLPLMVLTGLTMSPTMDAAWPWLPVVFDGRQSARTIHFICAFSLVGFFFLHIALVLVSGLLNNLRSMITGAYHVKHDAQGNALDPHD